MNDIEKTSVAKGVAIYMIDHLLIENPIKESELESVARNVTKDMGITESDESDSIAALATEYLTNDKKIVMESKDGVLWAYHKRSV